MVREGMRGADHQQNHMFSYLSPEMRVRKDQPRRSIRAMVEEVLSQLSRRFDNMYAKVGRPSIAPEKLLRAQLLQMLYSIRSERLLMEEMDYNLLFRWFVGLNADDDVWDATVFTKNRDRLLEADVAKEFLVTVGGDKGFDTRDFVKECRNLRVTPHVAQNLGRRGGSAIDSRTTRHSGYIISQKKRKRIEECFGWLKTIALMRKVRHRGVNKVHWVFTLACAVYNLVRMRNLAAAVPAV